MLEKLLYQKYFGTVERYEGTPPLWHLLLKGLIKLGYKYEYLYLISVFFSSLGVGLLLFKLDIPKPIKLLLPFTYFIMYEYAIKARSYCLILPTLVLIADTYKDRENKPILYNFLLGILATISLHSALISGILYIFEFIGILKKIAETKQIKKYASHIISIIILSCLYVAILLCIIPNQDVYVGMTMMAFYENGTSVHIILGSIVLKLIEAFTFPNDPTMLHLIFSVCFIILLLFSVLYKCKKKSLFLSVFIAEFAFIFFIRTAAHHTGIIFLTFLFALYLVKDDIYEKNKKILKVLMIVLCIIQSVWSVKTIIPEIKYEYSASKSLANYIKQLDYKNMRIYSSGFYATAILPYFDENIFYNDRGDALFYRWAESNIDWQCAGSKEPMYDENIFADRPDMIILHDNHSQESYKVLIQQARNLEGYKETHFVGTDFYKGLKKSPVKEGYYVFERVK